MALRADPHLAAPILAHLADTGMRLDIALVGGFGFVGVLAHDVGGGKARLQIAMPEFHVARDIGVHPLGHRVIGNPLTNDRGAQCHRGVNIGHMRKDLILHRNQPRRVLRQKGRGCRNGRDRVAVIKHPVACQRVVLQVQILARKTRGKIGPCHHSLDPIQGQRLGRINALDPRMGMGRAHDRRPKHAGKREIRAITCPTCNLVQPIRAVGAGADQFVARLELILRHHAAPRISAAAS